MSAPRCKGRTGGRQCALDAKHEGPHRLPGCGANLDRHDVLLVCRLPHGHVGDHNTAHDDSGDTFPAVAS